MFHRILRFLIVAGPFLSAHFAYAERTGGTAQTEETGGTAQAAAQAYHDADEVARELASDLASDPFLKEWYLGPEIGAAPPPVPYEVRHGTGTHFQAASFRKDPSAYIRSPLYITVGKAPHRRTYIIPGVTDPKIIQAFLSVKPEEQARFALVRRYVLSSLAKHLHARIHAVGAVNIVENEMNKVEQGAMGMVKRVIARMRRAPAPGPSKKPPTQMIKIEPSGSVVPAHVNMRRPARETLLENGRLGIQEFLRFTDAQIVQRCAVIGRSNEHGGGASLGLHISIGLGPLNLQRRPAIGFNTGKHNEGGFSLGFFRGAQAPGPKGYAFGFTGEVEFSGYVRRSEPGEPRAIEKGMMRYYPSLAAGTHIVTHDFPDGFSMGLTVPLPNSDVLGGALGGLMGIVNAGGRFVRIGNSALGALEAASDYFTTDVENSQAPMLRFVWAPGKKLPMVQLGKRRISMGWIRALATGKDYCPVAELSSTNEGEPSP